MQISLRAARVNSNLTQEEVAMKLKVSRKTIINWETGETSPPINRMLELCRLYSVHMDDIFLSSQST